jgi:hypothetical protein
MTSAQRSRTSVLAFMLICACGVVAHAQTVDPRFTALLASEGCEDAMSQRLAKLLAIELDSLEQEREFSVLEQISQISVRCAGEFAEVEARSTSGKNTNARVKLAQVREADRPRAVALAATELVDQLRAEETKVPSAPESEPVVPAPARRVAPPLSAPAVNSPRGVRVGLLLGGGVARLGKPGTTLPALSLSIRPRLGKYFELAQDLELASGQAETNLARVAINAYSASLSALFGSDLGAMRFGAGVGVRAGFVRLNADPNSTGEFQGDHVDGFSSGVSGTLQLTTSPAAIAARRHVARYDVLISAVGEAGLTLLPLKGTDDTAQSVFELDGVWLRFSVGVGFAI